MEPMNGKNIHIIGIGGTGMSAIAQVLLEVGAVVSGSDRANSDAAIKLAQQGATVHAGHHAAYVHGADMVIYSSAIPSDNPELEEAKRLQIPLFKRAEFLNRLLAHRNVIAVAGTHGKTTTTSMLSWIAVASGLKPGYIIGSVPSNLNRNASAGETPLFLIEADEYDNMFLGLMPEIAVLTKVEHDHPDCFSSEAIYYGAFRAFLQKVRCGGAVLWNCDDPNQAGLIDAVPEGVRTYSYGTADDADFRLITAMVKPDGCYAFQLRLMNENVLNAVLRVPGRHNLYNAAAALAVCALKEWDWNKALSALSQFSGIARRFEIIAKWDGITIIDDYGHHPTEIRTTIEAAKDVYPKNRVWALWQPHTYSRTKTLLPEFCSAFEKADQLLVTNIYASREQQTDFGFEELKEAVRKIRPDAFFAETNQEAVSVFVEQLRPGDVVVTLSAGDANQIGLEALGKKRSLQIAKQEQQSLTCYRNKWIADFSHALCGGPADEIAIVETMDALIDQVRRAAQAQRKYKVVGGLTNVLFSDKGFDGLLIVNRTHALSIERGAETTRMIADSGMKLNDFVHHCASEHLQGMEWATLIPGSIGGAVYGNAGAYGSDTASVLEYVDVLIQDGEIHRLTHDELGYRYRSSNFKSGELKGILLRAAFSLRTGDDFLIQDKMNEIEQKRQKFDFGANGSLGSIFRNPEGDFAGRLITECGLRGYRIGNVAVTDFHGNIFVTRPGATSAEFVELVRFVHAQVFEQFGIELTTEIEILEE